MRLIKCVGGDKSACFSKEVEEKLYETVFVIDCYYYVFL